MSRCVHLFLQSITPITAKRSRKTDSKTPPNPRGLSLRGCFLPVPQFALAFHVSSTLILEQPGNQWVKKHIIAETKHLQTPFNNVSATYVGVSKGRLGD
ncbi:hypothetical protein V6N12_000876 [Hibiscus sabdariffa]|uniref:Uncharacterized protein n=1 Tax=Hibiscus sabdariffa TaxID=183260 RepID=A0ABR2BXI6_9ROSI